MKRLLGVIFNLMKNGSLVSVSPAPIPAKTQTGGTIHQTETKSQMVLVAASSDNKDLVDDRSKNLQVYGKSDGDSLWHMGMLRSQNILL